MKPERSNYEIWLIDWFDGNLNSMQIEQLQLFLKENPDIREELEALNLIKLNPGEKSFSLKEKVKKSLEELTPEQFEYLAIARIENEAIKTIHKKTDAATMANARMIMESIRRTAEYASDIAEIVLNLNTDKIIET